MKMPCPTYFILYLTICICIRISEADSEGILDSCPTATLGKTQTLFINGYPCKDPENITPSDFKTLKLSNPGDTDNSLSSSVNMVTALEFPGLNTLGLSLARTDLAIDGMVKPHYHPRASEMLFVDKGVVLAGFTDSNNQLFETILREGDVFVIPRALLHFILNFDFELATVFSVFNSQNPGVVNINDAMFEAESYLTEKLPKRLCNLSASASKN